MGLRERNAAQTREAISEVALDLFVAQGFEATKMEEIAVRAGVGASTLYRYFPSKDQLLIEPLALRGQMAAALRERPADESLDLALGHALRALLTTPRPDLARLRQIFVVLESAPGPQARLLEDAARERVLLQHAIAERLGRAEDDLFCQATARLAMLVLELTGQGEGSVLADLARPDAASDNTTVVAQALVRLQDVLEQLHHEMPVVPRL